MKNSISEMRPQLISEWSKKNYPIMPDEVPYGSNKQYWWIGPCGHEWQTSAKARSAGEKCPICSNTRIIPGINDLHTLRPKLCEEWSDKNKPLEPTMVSLATHKKVIWKCKLGHEWNASVKSRTLNGTGCPYCSHNAVLTGFNDLATIFPEVAAEWSDRNLPLLPSQVTPFKNKKAWWKCSNGHEWYTLISTRSGGSKCPYCSGIITLKGFNDFKTLYPDLAAEWSDKNGDLKPDQINEKSTKNVWWTCKKCGNVWKGVVKSRVNGRKCPVCSEREVLAGYNDLVTTDPQIVMEWNRTMNAGVAPSRVSRNSLRPVWWKCALGHTWKDRICSRTIDKAPCPTCEAEFRRMLPQLLLLRYSKDNDLTIKLNDTKMVGVEVDAYIPELYTVITVIDRSTKSTSNIQTVIEHICRRSRIKYVKLDTRKAPEEVCNDIKAAFRAGNIFIRTDSEEDVRTARKQFGFWRRKNYMDENSPKP